MRLRNFKGFESFDVSFHARSYLVGPNSAGKSTVLAALRVAETCLRVARRRKSTLRYSHRNVWVSAYPVPTREFEALNESVRFNFRANETLLELVWVNGFKLRAIWPKPESSEDDAAPYFYLINKAGQNPRTTKEVRDGFSTIGIIPTLSPLEHEEIVRDDEYVRRISTGRLSSRHFRNQLRLLDESGDWGSFLDFINPWLGDLIIKKPVVHYAGLGQSSIDIFYTESGNPVEKELVWAGDGVQIWLQILLHIYRAQELPTVVLDEPEVFLHADLQRRLVKLLDTSGEQVVVATHSSEVLAEVDGKAIVWIDKSRKNAIRAPRDANLEQMVNALGSAFNLGLARALRAHGVLFVEGKDIQILRLIAKRLGFSEIIQDNKLAVVPIDGYSNWSHTEAFGWLVQDFLEGSVSCLVLLDRDYRTDAQVAAVKKKLSDVGLASHIWEMKELESYLIIPDVIARIAGADRDFVASVISEITEGMFNVVFARILAEKQATEKAADRDEVTITEQTTEELQQRWIAPTFRLSVCPPKEILSRLNSRLQQEGHKGVSFRGIANNVAADDLSSEMIELLRTVNGLGA